MYMAFSDKSELRIFLNNKKDWRKWLEQQRAYGDKITIEGKRLTDKQIEKLMKEN